MSTDPQQLAIIKAGLDAICREMAVNLRRSATSSIVREARDFSVALTDAKGEVVAQAECIPIMTAGISLAFADIAELVDVSTLTPDDAFIMNDPFSGGQHLQDIYLFVPIVVDGTVVGFGATTAHHVDLGGMHAGISTQATEIYQEGLRMPLSRFSISRDWENPRGFVRQVVGANVRVPDAVIGDLNAQFAANQTATRRLGELMQRHGVAACTAVMEELKDYSERRFRDAISQVPDGRYLAEEYFDGSAYGVGDVPICVQVEVAGDEMRVTFDGTGAQVLGNVNCPVASTVSAVQSAIRCCIPVEGIDFNEGCNRPIDIEVPYGSVLNPAAPAAVRSRLTPASRVFNAVVRALGEAIPEQAVATGFDTTTAIAVSSLVEGRYQVALEILGGGWGACAEHDGADGLDNPISNCANAPVEALETDFEHFWIDEYAIVDHSGGAGASAGGRGIRRSYVAKQDGVKVAGYSDRHREGPDGRDGGASGAPGAHAIVRADGSSERLSTNYEAVLNRGDRIVVVTGGGGGFGAPPADR
ncbi:hydantoinase B/oxoprolinase family protein [Leucobacter allii]|uniref:Hydantoinase B/oxoprolinase family protein n=1 Tax=Leucobacter allii TaxID=2932247 RepID=A0ABY4FLN3_9MICO|nr:hydantoinase B/oxoprolinase family protein [Leucobacter allii]UOQ57178.1 hydantoinase B/oxoprolinase family protein [Leucobacter allii]